MAPRTKPELAMEKLLQAKGNLQAYAESGVRDHEQRKELVVKLEIAISEFIDQTALPWPEDLAA